MSRHNLFNALREFGLGGGGGKGMLYSIPALESAGLGAISRLPFSIRVVLESVLRNVDGARVTEDHVRELAAWRPNSERRTEIPFVVARIVLQDFTGVPLLCDLAAMRGAVAAMGKDPGIIEPLVPVDLVVDHSVQIDNYGNTGALEANMEIEFDRNKERYEFLKWGMGAFKSFKVIPPGIGIIHQVNLEHLARGVHQSDGVYYPDTLVGTDSHTTMINGIGSVGWGVGGIEAEAGMLGQPVYFLTPDVIGVELKGRLRDGVTATDLVLTMTEMLRKEKVVGQFVEFFGEGVSTLSVPDRATVANMAPEYGATMGYFPVDETTVEFMSATGKSAEEVSAFSSYFKAQGLFGLPERGQIDYTRTLAIDLSAVSPSVAGPRRPQDRINLSELERDFRKALAMPSEMGGFQKTPDELARRVKIASGIEVGNGDVIIAAIASCTNTSNPGVMLAAGLLAKKAAEKGLRVKRHVKTSISPGSRVVKAYLENSGLLPYLELLGFYVSAYGCATCIGNAGQLNAEVEEAIVANGLVCSAVLSGNRNFEARIHPNLRANFLMSPPLVVAYAIAGTVLWDMESEPIGADQHAQPVYLWDIWPTNKEIAEAMRFASDPEMYRRLYSDFTGEGGLWQSVESSDSVTYAWPASTYIAEPPFFAGFKRETSRSTDISDARALGIFGDSVTTDHISPAGSIKESSAAGQYLMSQGVARADFQSYGTRRGNHEVMIRGTFANVRIRNLMLPPGPDGSRVEGGLTLHQPSGERMFIYDAAMRYKADGVPVVVFGGEEYGTGSSRDWAAKGTMLLGVRAVIARSFERIHRSNLVGMGVLPLQFMNGESAQTLDIKGDERISISGLSELRPRQELTMTIQPAEGSAKSVSVICRIDTPIEVEYFNHGGIMPYVLRGLTA